VERRSATSYLINDYVNLYELGMALADFYFGAGKLAGMGGVAWICMLRFVWSGLG
jgi:hypothetical protein